ncbi:Na(+)/H(+) antiporter subunit F1 [Virgibacillus sp. FSP13]
MNDFLDFTKELIHVSTIICIVAISVSLLLLLIRVIIGPSNADRAVALDGIGINLMGLAALISVILVTTKLNDVVLLIGILLFIGTLAIAKYLEKGVIIDRDVD